MHRAAPDCDSSYFLDKKRLVNLKTKAMRSGAWFKALQRIDRVLFDLTIRVVDNIRSANLEKSIVVIVRKLEYNTKSNFSGRLKEIGFLLVKKISSLAQKLGNVSATDWVFDSSFADFLAVMHVNARMHNR